MKTPRKKKLEPDPNKRVLRDSLVVLLMQDIKRQVQEGRPRPKNLDFDQICDLLDRKIMRVEMKEGNPNYPELVFDP